MRLAIATHGYYNKPLSVAKMVLCNMGGDREVELAKKDVDNGVPYDYIAPQRAAGRINEQQQAENAVGCNGESMIGAWQFLYRFGVPTEACMTYEHGEDDGVDLAHYVNGQDLPICSSLLGQTFDTCPVDQKPMQLHMADGFYLVPGVKNADPKNNPGVPDGNEFNIRRDIYHWGPVTSGFTVHEDFMTWDCKGVYQWDGKSAESGGHAIVIVGWGTEPAHSEFNDGDKDMPYWIVRNSWGPEWGDHGYFKILRGSNHCQIEENIVVGIPCLFGIRLFLEWPLLYRSDDYALRAMWGVRPSGYKTTTFESMSMGLIKPNLDIIRYQYVPSVWPDMSHYVAGDPSTHIYRIAEHYSMLAHPFTAFGLGSGKEYVIGAIAGSLLTLAVVGAVMFAHKHYKTKK
jgi:hypothetical protein